MSKIEEILGNKPSAVVFHDGDLQLTCRKLSAGIFKRRMQIYKIGLDIHTININAHSPAQPLL